MKLLRNILVTGSLILYGATTLPAVRGDEWDKTTKMTFSAPTELPTMVLPAGTYTFTLLDLLSDRNIVQVWNADRTKLLTTLIAIPDYRLTTTDKTVITFEERAKGSPEAIRAWFYPGDQYGQEFVYPRVRAMQLAQANKQHVPAMPEHTPPITKSSELRKVPITAIQSSGQEVQLAEVHNSPPPAQTAPTKPVPVQTAKATPKMLPKTASLMPLIGLVGFLSMGMAFALRHLSGAMLARGTRS